MNRFYLIAPLVFAAVFGGIYWQHTKSAAAEAVAKQAEVARVEQEAAAKKAAAEQQARDDADKRSAARLAEEKKAEADKKARWETETQTIAADTKTYQNQAVTSNKELARLNAELIALRATKEAAAQEAFEFARSIELDRIKKRNAELEIQRLTELLTTRATGSSLASTR